jgi:hypothetical protein
MQYASGRVKGDIGIDGHILIEIKDSMKSTGQLQRLMGQLDLYNGLWKGKVIVVVCGDSQRDLVNTLTKKVDSFRADFLTELLEDKKIHLVIRGSGKPKEDSWW